MRYPAPDYRPLPLHPNLVQLTLGLSIIAIALFTSMYLAYLAGLSALLIAINCLSPDSYLSEFNFGAEVIAPVAFPDLEIASERILGN